MRCPWCGTDDPEDRKTIYHDVFNDKGEVVDETSHSVCLNCDAGYCEVCEV
jgi:hypothetical protein